jgi:hypothetical protein
MRYLDFDLEISPGSGGTYAVTTRSRAGEKTETIRFPFDERTLRERRQDLQIALLQSLLATRQVLSPEQQVVQDFGKQLFETLMVGDIRSRYDVCRHLASQQEETGVRLRLNIQAPELVALPWEFLYDEREGEYICFSRSTTLIRYLGLTQPIQSLTVAPPLRILGMIATPADRAQLDTSREQARLTEALGDLEKQGVVKLYWMPGQTWQDLQRELRRDHWHVFHFIGHGSFDSTSREGFLALADEAGKTQRFGAVQLSRLLKDHASLRLVVLNACEGARSDGKDVFSSTAATLAQRGIPAVLAMQYAISDHAAIHLTQMFYEALADGQAVDEAVAEARKAISSSNSRTLEWGTPVLYMRSTDGVLFKIAPSQVPVKPPKQPLSQPPNKTPSRSPQQQPVLPVRPAPPSTPPDELWKGGVEISLHGRRYLIHDPVESIESTDHSFTRQRAKARQLETDRDVWLKQVVVFRRIPAASEAVDQLGYEARLLNQLEELRQDFPRQLDLENRENASILVYSFTRGPALAQTFGPLGRVLDTSRAHLLLLNMRSLCAMLAVLHRQRIDHRTLAHRTLTPEQIVLLKDGSQKSRAVLRDLGLAALPFSSGEGPALYRAPEQANYTLAALAGPKIDIYQLGAVLYHLLTGQLPTSFIGGIEPPSTWNPSLPAALDEAILRALADAPGERWEDMLAFRAALDRASDQLLSILRGKT